MSKTYLKIKIVSLAAESRLIRREERRFPRGRRNHPVCEGLRAHRTYDVRNEARAALLAYGYLRGRPYGAMEAKTYTSPDWTRVAALVSKYGPARVTPQVIREWADTEALVGA